MTRIKKLSLHVLNTVILLDFECLFNCFSHPLPIIQKRIIIAFQLENTHKEYDEWTILSIIDQRDQIQFKIIFKKRALSLTKQKLRFLRKDCFALTTRNPIRKTNRLLKMESFFLRTLNSVIYIKKRGLFVFRPSNQFNSFFILFEFISFYLNKNKSCFY